MLNAIILLGYKDEEDDQIYGEVIRASKIGDYFRIDTPPIFGEGVAVNDIVAANPHRLTKGLFQLSKLIKESGNSVVQMIVHWEMIDQVEDELMDQFQLSIIKEIQPSTGEEIRVAIDVPKTFFYPKLRRWLDKKLEIDDWDYREACLSENHKAIIKWNPTKF